MTAQGHTQCIPVALGDRSYEIEIAVGLLHSGRAAEAIAGLYGTHRVCIVTHPKLAPLYAAPIQEGLHQRGIETTLVSIPSGEHRKNLAAVARLYEAFLAARLDRKCGIVAVGGGVLGDVVGFAAATYLRGIDFIQVPTTLLAQVDSSVGGKTGVDLPQGKNLVGAFHQPRRVLIDTDTLATLPPRELRSGIAEIIKYGIIYDSVFFDRLAKDTPLLLRRDPDALAYAIARSCEIKAEVVSQDETEQGITRNFEFRAYGRSCAGGRHEIPHISAWRSHYAGYGRGIASGRNGGSHAARNHRNDCRRFSGCRSADRLAR